MNEQKIERLYNQELEERTARTGFWGSLLIFLTAIFFAWQDAFFLSDFYSISFQFRFITMVSAFLYLVLYFPVLRYKPRLGYVLYAVNFVTLQTTTWCMVFLVFSVSQVDAHKFGIIGGLTLLYTAIYLLADGLRRHLWFILAIPSLIFFFVLILALNLPTEEIAYFSNSWTLILAVAFLGIIDDNLRFREFRARKLSERQREQLVVEVERRKRAEKKYAALAATDELTGLFNRRASIQILKDYDALSQRLAIDLTVCFIDMDYLKDVNDIYGHKEGDTAIKIFSDTILNSIRRSDHVGRLVMPSIPMEAGADGTNVGRVGGDEFLVTLMGCNKENAEILMGRIQFDMKEAVEKEKKPYDIRFSYGIVESTSEDRKDIDQMIAEADQLMYLSKQARKVARSSKQKESKED